MKNDTYTVRDYTFEKNCKMWEDLLEEFPLVAFGDTEGADRQAKQFIEKLMQDETLHPDFGAKPILFNSFSIATIRTYLTLLARAQMRPLNSYGYWGRSESPMPVEEYEKLIERLTDCFVVSWSGSNLARLDAMCPKDKTEDLPLLDPLKLLKPYMLKGSQKRWRAQIKDQLELIDDISAWAREQS
ncbi:MAG: hypothetical protein ACYSW6_10485 [Planctomycetota bacterium]|jgi:hypothetical protein